MISVSKTLTPTPGLVSPGRRCESFVNYSETAPSAGGSMAVMMVMQVVLIVSHSFNSIPS